LTKIQGVEAQNLESLDFVKIIEDREQLLQGYEDSLKEVENLNFKNFIFAFMIFFGGLLIFLPKVIVGNMIYKKSIHINKLEKELKFLLVQNREISQKLEKIIYKIETP